MELRILFILLISAGLAFGIYGVVIEQGANLVKIDSRTALISMLWGAVELAALLAGYGAGRWILMFETGRRHSIFWVHLLAGLFLTGIGIGFLIKAFKNKTFEEHRIEQLDLQKDFLPTLRVCIYGVLAGVACGLLEYSLSFLLISAFVVSVLSALGGYISGQVWGAEPCSKAFGIGGILLILIGIALQIVHFL